MIPRSSSVKKYSSASKRFLGYSIRKFFEKEFPKTFGPVILDKIAETIVETIDKQLPKKDYLRPGQCIWNAASVNTRPDNPNCQFIPIILTLIDDEDIKDLSKGTKMTVIAKNAVARMTQEAYQQGALLSMRDIGLLVWRCGSTISATRKQWEDENNQLLPHVGNLQDFGTCISHKELIIRKVVFEGKSPSQVAQETLHSQKAVDNYLKDYNRVKTCYTVNPDPDFIVQATGLSLYLVKQYIKILENKELKP